MIETLTFGLVIFGLIVILYLISRLIDKRKILKKITEAIDYLLDTIIRFAPF